MKNKSKNSKNKSSKQKKSQNEEIDLSEEKQVQNENEIIEEEIINTDLPKKNNNKAKNKINNNNIKKDKNKKKKSKNNKKKSDNNKKEKEEKIMEEDLNLADAIVLNPSQISSLPKITQAKDEDENIIDNINQKNNIQKEKEEFKIAKYFSQTKLIEPKNTNKDLLFIPEEDVILSLCDGKLYSLNINTYKIISTYYSPKNNIINFTYNDKLRQIITLLESSMITIFDFDTEKIISQIKIHKAVGKIVKIDPSKNFFAVVTSRNNINIYNMKNLSLETVLEDHTHIIYDIIFNPNKEKFELYSCSEDCTIRVWNLLLRKCTNYFYHIGVSIRYLQITNDGNFLIGGTLDNKIYIWKILAHQENNNNIKPKIYNYNKNDEQINFECMLYYTKISTNDNTKIKPTLLLGDDEGNLIEVDLNNGNIIDTFFTNIHQPIVQVYFYENEKDKEKYLYAFTNDQFLIKMKINILQENISNANIESICPFYCQEILSLKWIDDSCNSFLFSSNDNMLKTYDIENNKINIYEGHTDFIMSITVKNNLIITSSKDNTIRIWKINNINDIKSICILKGHSEAVNASDIYIKKNNYLISGCKDGSIKLWDINQLKDIVNNDNINNDENLEIIEIKESLSSKVVHDNEINAIKFSPNGKIFASGSYDKSIKLFEISSNNNDFNLIHTLTGHKKGVTDISFSPYAKILASCGTDKLIKMWNLSDYTCLNTYEGHLSSVLKIDWIYRGTHLISGGGDGLIKLWNIKTSENILTLDAHDGKIWTFDINKNNNINSESLCFISGATDGKIILWKDNTKEEELNLNNENLIRIQKEDKLRMMNYSKEYIESMKLSLELNHKKNFIDAFDNYLQMRINEEIQKINEKNNLIISNYTLPKIKDADNTNDDLLNIIIQNEKELDQIYSFSSSENNEEKIINSYEKIIDNICKEEQLKNIIITNINRIMDIIMENNINVRGGLGAQVLLKIVLKYVTPEKFYKKIIKEDKDKNKFSLDEETIEDLLEGGIYANLGIKGGKALSKEEKKELRILQKKTKREEETLLQKLEIIEGYSNQHLKRIKKEIVNSQILGYEINKLKAMS